VTKNNESFCRVVSSDLNMPHPTFQFYLYVMNVELFIVSKFLLQMCKQSFLGIMHHPVPRVLLTIEKHFVQFDRK
jgi:hypothetical protein